MSETLNPIIPVVLFAYARPDYLKRTLQCLRENNIQLLYAYSDGPKIPEITGRVNEVRKILRDIDWCEVHLVERPENLGLGKSILAGVADVLQEHDAVIVFEDDLICVPGTYHYLCAALEQYRYTSNVMSVTGWTHPRATPGNVKNQPYFDGRTDCLVWGTWKRAWRGMERDSLMMIEECKQQGIDIYRYGADLLEMAKLEMIRNIWAVRFSYLHILHKGICLRPPYSLVQHIGYDSESVNVKNLDEYIWHVDLPKHCPPIPQIWPEAVENPECPILWQKACGGRPDSLTWVKIFMKKILNLRKHIQFKIPKSLYTKEK
jgi:hypothetical protein